MHGKSSRFGLGLALTAGMIAGCAQTPQWAQNPFTAPARDRELRYSFAQVQERDGNLFKAERTYRDLHREAPKETRFAQRLGVVLVRQGNIDEGLPLLQQAAQQAADDLSIHNDLGYAYLISGDFAAAETEFRRALAIDGRDQRTINNLALAVGYAGRTNECYELFRKHSSEAVARSNVAYVLAQRGEMELAVQEYNRALSSDPQHKPAAEALIQLTELQRDLQATRDDGVQFARGTKSARPKLAEPGVTPGRVRLSSIASGTARPTGLASEDAESPPIRLVGRLEVDDDSPIETPAGEENPLPSQFD